MTLACTEIDTALAGLAPLGYVAEFVERDLPNTAVKHSFLSKPHHRHDLAFTRAARGLPIELIQYDGLAAGGRGEFCGYFEQAAGPTAQPVKGPKPAAITFEHAGSSGQEGLYELPGFCTAAVFDPASKTPGGLTMAGVVTEDLAASRRFWCEGLGYKLVSDNESSSTLAFRSPVAAWTFTVVLAAGPSPKTLAMLDSVGMTCFSHLCTALPRDRDRLLEAGASAASTPFEMTINGKSLLLEILRGPSGELIELLQVAT